MTTKPSHVAIPASRTWGYRILVVGVLMVGGGVFGFAFNPPPLSWIAACAGGLGLLIAVGVWPFFLNHPPAVESDGDGVTVRTMSVTVVRLPWGAIEGFEVVRLRNSSRWLAIRVRDPEGVAELCNPALAEAMERARDEGERATGRRYGALIPRANLRGDLDAIAESLNGAMRAARA